MADQSKLQSVALLAQLGENAVCADCQRADWDDLRAAEAAAAEKKNFFKSKTADADATPIPATVTTHVDLKHGVFLCRECAGAHLRLPEEFANVKTVEIVDRDAEALATMEARGNAAARAELEAFLPRYVARPEAETAAALPELLLDWARRKYAERDFAVAQDDMRMPEAVHELPCAMLKGKSSWSKAYFVHLAFWAMLFENATESTPLLTIEIDKIKRCSPWPVKAKKKDEGPVMAFIIQYFVEKDGQEIEKSVTVRLASLAEVVTTVESLRKAMVFYADGQNRPKLFKPAKATKISRLITSNTPAHGSMERRAGKNNWRAGHFSIIQDTLYTFKSESSRTPLELTPLHNTDCKRRVELFQERRYSFAVVGPEKTLFFAVETEAELGNAIRWLRERQHANPPRFRFDFVAPAGRPARASEAA